MADIFKSYYDDPIFADNSQHDLIIGPMPHEEDFWRKKNKLKPPANVAPELLSLYLWPLLDRDQEYHLFRKYNYQKRQYVSGLIGCEDAKKTRDIIILCNGRLIASTAKTRPHKFFQDLLGIGQAALAHAIDKFKFNKICARPDGTQSLVKFSTYATIAMHNAYTGFINKEFKYTYANLDVETYEHSKYCKMADPADFEAIANEEQAMGRAIAVNLLNVLKANEHDLIKRWMSSQSYAKIALDTGLTINTIRSKLLCIFEKLRRARPHNAR